MSTIRVLIADDEPLAREILRIRLEREPDFDLVGEAEDGEMAVEAIRTLLPDLVFLDIQMPGLNGFQVLEEVAEEFLPHVIFVTAFDEFAVRAFEVHAVDYLLKPFDGARLDRTLGRVRDQLGDGDEARRRIAELMEARDEQELDGTGTLKEAGEDGLRRIIVKHRNRYLLIPAEKVDWIESAGNYVRIHVGTSTYMLRATMTEMEQQLSADQFVRIHRRRIINIDRVSEIRPEAYGDFEVVLTSGEELRMSRSYRSNLLP